MTTECQQIRAMTTLPLNEQDYANIEDHLTTCSECTAWLESQDAAAAPIDAVLHQENQTIVAPGSILASLQSPDPSKLRPNHEPAHASQRQVQNQSQSRSQPVHATLSKNVSQYRYLALAIAASALIAVTSPLLMQPPEDRTSLSLGEDDRDRNRAAHDNPPQQDTSNESASQPDPHFKPPQTAASLPAADNTAAIVPSDDFFVAAQSTEAGEIPFFWVLPKNSTTESNSLRAP